MGIVVIMMGRKRNKQASVMAARGSIFWVRSALIAKSPIANQSSRTINGMAGTSGSPANSHITGTVTAIKNGTIQAHLIAREAEQTLSIRLACILGIIARIQSVKPE